MTDTKICSRCKEEKPLEAFSKVKVVLSKGVIKETPISKCKDCKKISDREYNQTDKRNLYIKLHRMPKEIQDSFTVEQYLELKVKQDNKCAICRQPETAVQKGKLMDLAIDHCHQTNKVRGLLCFRCNVSLKVAERMLTEPDYLERVRAYLASEGDDSLTPPWMKK